MRIFLIFIFLLSTHWSLQAQSNEVCSNGLDDDGDNLVDCDDPDCQSPQFVNDYFEDIDVRAFEIDDLDNDNDMDIFFASYTGRSNGVFINQGGIQGGAFGDFQRFDIEGGVDFAGRDVALGDLDSDGDLDAIVVNGGSASAPGLVFINQGGIQNGIMGNYLDSGQILGNGYAVDVELGDLDGDGDLDAFVAYDCSGGAKTFINQGGDQLGVAGEFQQQQTFPYACYTALKLADFDNDGDLDSIFSLRNDVADQVFINQGGVQGGSEGIFAIDPQSINDGFSTKVLECRDIDLDGDVDVILKRTGFQTAAGFVYVNQGGDQGGQTGVFAVVSDFFTNATWYDLSFGDLDLDGNVDVVLGADFNLKLLFNEGPSNTGIGIDFAEPGQDFGHIFDNCSVIGVRLADIDNDSDLDVIALTSCAAVGGESLEILINIGGEQGGDSGFFVSNKQTLGSQPGVGLISVDLADFDGDGDLDIWKGHSQVADELYLNKGGLQNGIQGEFEKSELVLPDLNTKSISLVDIDNDSDVDVWGVTGNLQPDFILINQGGEQLGSEGDFAQSNFPSSATFGCEAVSADLDNDGDADLIAVIEGGSHKVYLNQGGIQGGDVGTFVESTEIVYAGVFGCSSLSIGDLDGDGDLDAVLCSETNSIPAKIYLNQGGLQGGIIGQFAPGSDIGPTGPTNLANHEEVKIGDIDNDGDLDLFLMFRASYTQPHKFYINQGGDQLGIEGEFVESGQEFLSYFWRRSVFDDFDHDGDLDLLVASQNVVFDAPAGTHTSLLINQGGAQGGSIGTFVSAPGSIGVGMTDFAVGDINGDFVYDIVAAQYNFRGDHILLGGLTCNDDDSDGVPDYCDVDFSLGNDCDLNGVVDSCQSDNDSDGLIDECDPDIDGDGILNDCDVDLGGLDCDESGVVDLCEIASGLLADCDLNGVADECEIAEGQGFDCNANGLLDSCDISNGSSFDCDNDSVPDECKGGLFVDCNLNGTPDECELNSESAADCNGNGSLDECDLANGYEFDCDLNGQLDVCDISEGTADCDFDGVPDSCQVDSDSDGTIDPCDDDLDGDGIPNSCDVDQTAGADCDLNGQDDSCQDDMDSDGIIDPCDDDIDGDGIPNNCDLDLTSGEDCDQDGQDDSCQPDGDADGEIDPCDPDLDNDGILNACDPDHSMGEDCNSNGILDNCDISGGAEDNNSNGIPDECEETLFIRGDVNGDSGIDISDAITVLGYLFTGGNIDCEKAADSNDDGAVNVADGIQILGYLFSGTGDPPAPFPDCGGDPTPDSLGCEFYSGCL